MHNNNAGARDYLSSYYAGGAGKDVTAEDISKHLKLAAGLINYPTRKGTLVETVDTHSLVEEAQMRLHYLDTWKLRFKKWDD